jgi:hypothetical protein
MTAEPQTETGPEVLEAGRYRVFQDASGAWIIGRAVATCERCQACGCGDQADPIQIPAMLIAMAKQGGGMSRIKEGLKGLVGRG